MTCKDLCIHCDVCIMANKDDYLNEEVLAADCSQYKPKSRFVELPCEVGQSVYCLVDGFKEPMEARIYSITIQKEGVIMRCGVKGYYGVSYMSTDYGKKFFGAKEEAEKALAERSNT